MWSSKYFQESKPAQKIWYLSPINQSPTSLAVVGKKLVRVQKVAEECRKKTISVIAIAENVTDLTIIKKRTANPIFR